MISRSAPASAASAATSSMPGVSTTGSSSLGTVLVAGRKRVPNPAAGTTAVSGTGTRARVIVHTLSPSDAVVMTSPVTAPCHRGRVGSANKGRDADGDPGGPSHGDACKPTTRRPKRSAAIYPAMVGGGADRLRLRTDPIRAGVNRPVGHVVTARCPGAAPRRAQRRRRRPAADAVGPVPTRAARPGTVGAARAAGAVAARRGGGRRGRGVRARAGGRSGGRSPRAAARGIYDRSLPLANPSARLVAVVRDDELVDEIPAEPHDVRMTHALTPRQGLVELG